MSDPTDPTGDPGWRMPLRDIPWSLVPILRTRRYKRLLTEGKVDFLIGLRFTFVTFAVALVEIGVVVLILANSSSLEDVGLRQPAVGLGIAVLGGASLSAVRFFGRPLDCSSDGALVSGYRTRFFVQLACAESAALFGFLGFILTVNPLMYAIGAAFTAIGFTRLAPSARNLARDQEQLAAAGCPHNLTALLRSVFSTPE